MINETDVTQDTLPLLTPFLKLSRDEWATFRKDTQMTFNAGDVKFLNGQIETVSLSEIKDVYLPLSRLLNMQFNACKDLKKVSSQFLDRPQIKTPFMIGVTGSVSVGKSTTSRILKVLLEKWDNFPRVRIITTDSFLYSNKVLEEKGILDRKGFPESFDSEIFIKFLLGLRSGKQFFKIPVYSHQIYDILPHQFQTIEHPDIVILEGLNLLQISQNAHHSIDDIFVSDILDYSIYIDALSDDIKDWFLERFMFFRDNAKSNDHDFYYQFSKMSEQEAVSFATNIWKTINEVNLYEHILPFRNRAQLILVKEKTHQINEILLNMI